MIECSTCGRCIGHMYEDYYNLGHVLSEIIAGKTSGDLADEDHSDVMQTDGKNLWTYFLQPYFQYLKTHPDEDVPSFTPYNLVARALLRIHPWKPTDLPFWQPVNGHHDMRNPKYCCMRMFTCDNSKATY